MIMKNVTVVNHPILKHNLAVIRNKTTTREQFLSAFKKISYFLLETAFLKLPTKTVLIETPLETMKTKVIDEKYTYIIAPILRAGLALTETAVELLPQAHVLHIGMYRDEKTKKPVWYYDKTPTDLPRKTKVFILDPMLATGGSALASVELFQKKGVDIKDMVFISVLSAPEGIKTLKDVYPDLKIVTGALDKCLNSNAYIVPGLGDAGDRYFNSLIP